MSRQVITQSQVEELLAKGVKEVVLEPNAIITAVAQEIAQDRGLRLVRQEAAGAVSGEPVNKQAAAQEPPVQEVEREQVRKAVIANLGEAPEGLDAVLDRVMGH